MVQVTGVSEIDDFNVSTFTNFFFRDFSYINDYDSEVTYNTGDQVFFNNLLWRSLTDSNTASPPDTNNWEGSPTDIDEVVVDKDIRDSVFESLMNYNAGLFPDDDEKVRAFLYLTAHNLVMKRFELGLKDTSTLRATSVQVGSVSETLNINNKFSKSPTYSGYFKSSYGQKYLQLISTKVVGNIFHITGKTNA